MAGHRYIPGTAPRYATNGQIFTDGRSRSQYSLRKRSDASARCLRQVSRLPLAWRRSYCSSVTSDIGHCRSILRINWATHRCTWHGPWPPATTKT
ncbi:unnamed protein product, partial [Trichogramma brassicae]